MRPCDLSRMKIPLCRLIPLPLVRPVLQSDMKHLENDFIFGYNDGDRVMYVSLTNDRGQKQAISDDIKNGWDEHWIAVNTEFEESLEEREELSSLSGFMFFIWDGNHRHSAWSGYIN
jgi:hypothetical protein